MHFNFQMLFINLSALPISFLNSSTGLLNTKYIFSFLIMFVLVKVLGLTEGHLCRRDFKQLRGDGSLANLVVLQREILDELVGVVSRVFHGDHS